MPQTKLGKFSVHYQDQKEFHSIKREIFAEDVYHIELENQRPIIIDAGAHIGLASLYFLSRYPLAKIIAIEPHPVSFALLKQNIWENRLEDQVTLINAALAAEAGTITLHADPTNEWLSTASIHQGAWTDDQETEALEVPAITLESVLTEINQPVDLLKLDVEGAEEQILFSSSPENFHTILLEVHDSSSDKIEKMLTKMNFTVKKIKKTGGLKILQASK